MRFRNTGESTRDGRSCFLRSLRAIVAVSCAACAGVQPSYSGSASDSLHLRVIATHDLHGTLRPVIHAWSGGRPVGGASALKAVMDSAERRCACPTVRLDGGDQMQGSLESNLVYGASVVQAFNLIGLDAAAVGNHELDWGVDTLLARQGEADYAWLAANVYRVDNGERPPWARGFTLIEESGVRVAVIGYATVRTPATLRPAVTAPYHFRAGSDGIRDALEAVRRQHPDFTIIVAHAGGDCDEARCAGEMVDLAAGLPPDAVQLIVGGHDHSTGQGVVNAVPIVRAGGHARAIAVVDLFRRADGSRTFHIAHDTVFADAVDEDPGMIALLERYAAIADSVGGGGIATLREQTPPARLGDLIADAVRWYLRADFGIHNAGGVRAELAAGAVTYADLFRVLPFDNRVVQLRMTGRQLREVVEHAVAGRPHHFSNLRVEYIPEAPNGRRVVSLTSADGTLIRDDAEYTLATVDFLADGAEGFRMLIPLPREPSGTVVLDALISYLRQLPEPVVAPQDPRAIAVRR
ncbi:MAG: bifunctional metallophosphatase/5'-nucleotidase [Gemmatimonadetes bacterium]|nr:bifunctional metallophosphatase/5'-nucleotidase [Gemmatimonadota bacterium]